MIAHVKSAPSWIWAIIIGLSLIEPATHLWLMVGTPANTVHTGMHIADSVIFIHAMRMFDTDFWAPYVTCNAGDLGHSPKYFPVPFLWMYGAVGEIGRQLNINEFFMLGLANAIGAAFYLSAVYSLMRTIVPKIANRAFLLFALGGGLGGVAYLASMATGFTSDPEFESSFFRLALYELLEGARMAPWLVSPRLYYTVPLTLGYLAFTALHNGLAKQSNVKFALAAVLVFAATFLNIRLGPFIWAIAILLVYCDERTELRSRIKIGIALTVAAGLALSMAFTMLQWNQVYTDNAFALIRRGMWLSPFVTASVFLLLLVPGTIKRAFDTLPNHAYYVGCGIVGYAVAYVSFYVAYQVYYGSYWPPADYSASVRISDPALVGVLAGVAYAYANSKFRDPILDEDTIPMHWITLWFLIFVTIAPSAFAQGWFLRLGPQRLILFMGPPMCILAAQGLERLELRHTYVFRSLLTIILVCGAASIIVAALFFQGPLNFTPGKSAFAQYHGEVIAEADGELLAALGEGMVLTPTTLPLFGDVVTIRGNTALVGLGAWDLSDLSAAKASEISDTFFNDGSTEETRRDIAITYCAAWVYCPTTPPLPDDVLADYRGYDWLEEIANRDGGAVFRVTD